MTSDLHLHLASAFLRIPCIIPFEQKGHNIGQFLSEFLNSIMGIAVCEAAPEVVRTAFIDLLLKLANVRWHKIKSSPALIYSFLKLSTPPMFRLAGVLTGGLSRQQPFISELIGNFTQLLQSSPANDTAFPILSFFANYHVESISATRQIVLQFLSSFGEVKDDDFLAQLIYAARHLEIIGFDYFNRLCQRANGPKAIYAAVESTIILRQLVAYQSQTPSYQPYQRPEI
jgi:hypothetical protein